MRAVGGEDGGRMEGRAGESSRGCRAEAGVCLTRFTGSALHRPDNSTSHCTSTVTYSNLHGSWHRQRGRVPDLLCSMLCMCDNNSRHKLRF
jgi:hypothetical protein